jgi:1-acyl-sn-glycerol-3-phosphate acyltransferase
VNSGLYWSRFNPLRYPGTIVVSILPPIADELQDAAFLGRLSEVIERECDRLLVEAARAPEQPNFGPEAARRLALLTDAE